MRERNVILKNITLFLSLLLTFNTVIAATACDKQGIWLQVLGSGGPELGDERASSSYIVWKDGKARVLVDMGAGGLLRFEQSGAQLNDIDVILMTHLHVDHSNDLPAFIKGSFFTGRQQDLHLYGPTGNELMPTTSTYVQALLGENGAYRYLKDYVQGTEDYQLVAHDVDAGNIGVVQVANSPYNMTAIRVHHGPIPALAWRVEIDERVIVFSGDMSNRDNRLARHIGGADLLVAHHGIREQANKIARNLHMPPSEIGKIAAKAKVKQLVISHRMRRTLGHEESSRQIIAEHYAGPLQFADDLECFKP
jgi:ribonuclease BN (tRNA processing enzyme)